MLNDQYSNRADNMFFLCHYKKDYLKWQHTFSVCYAEGNLQNNVSVVHTRVEIKKTEVVALLLVLVAALQILTSSRQLQTA